MFFLSGTPEALQLNLSILVVMALFVVFHLVMKRLLYGPLLRTLEERDERTSGTLASAARTDSEYRALLERYEATIKDARMEGYIVGDRARKQAQVRHGEILKSVQADMQQDVEVARQEIRRSAEEMKQALEAEIGTYAGMIVLAILHRGEAK
jgi:F-type H+-transporting ATPase subunit b